jgi:hypothetical protein
MSDDNSYLLVPNDMGTDYVMDYSSSEPLEFQFTVVGLGYAYLLKWFNLAAGAPEVMEARVHLPDVNGQHLETYRKPMKMPEADHDALVAAKAKHSPEIGGNADV